MNDSPWPLMALGEVITERQEEPSFDVLLAGEIPIVEKISFDEGKIYLRDEKTTKTKMILIRPGDLVLSGINAAKGAIAIYDRENDKPIAATIHYGAYIPNQKADVRFLWWLLRSSTFREILSRHLPGGIKTELRAKRLLPIPVPLPSLPEQHRIVLRIESLAAKVRDAHKLRQESITQIERLMSSAINGEVGSNPNGKLKDVLLEKPRNGWSARCDNTPNGTPVLMLSAVTGFSYRGTEYKTTSQTTVSEAYYWLEEGDLLITRSNTPELVGHAAIYSGQPSPCIYPDLMMRLTLDSDKADVNFVHTWLKSVVVREYITRNAKGTSPTMKKINQKTVMNIPFPSAISLPEQRRIVAHLDALQAKLNAVQQHQVATQARLDALLPSILDKAFKGEL